MTGISFGRNILSGEILWFLVLVFSPFNRSSGYGIWDCGQRKRKKKKKPKTCLLKKKIFWMNESQSNEMKCKTEKWGMGEKENGRASDEIWYHDSAGQLPCKVITEKER